MEVRSRPALLDPLVIAIIVSVVIMAFWTRPLLGAPDLSQEQRRQVLGEAQDAFDRGMALLPTSREKARAEFQSAAERFQLLVDEGLRNGPLFYNLANAYLQIGDLGRAILNYRRAETYMSGDERLTSNLDYARSLCRSQVPASGQRALTDALLTWHRHTSMTSRFVVFAAAYVLFWLILLAARFKPGAWWRIPALASLVLWLVVGGSVAADLWLGPVKVAGVVMVDEVTVRKGNGEGFAPQFEEPLHEGAEFTLIERRGGWLHIALPNGTTGWIREAQAEIV